MDEKKDDQVETELSLSASTSSNDTSSNKITLNETSVDEEEATESAHDKFLKLQSVFGQSVTFKKVDNQPKRMIGLKSDSNTSEEDNQLEERKEDEQSDIPANENSPKSLENELTLHSDTSDEEINVEDELLDEILSSICQVEVLVPLTKNRVTQKPLMKRRVPSNHCS